MTDDTQNAQTIQSVIAEEFGLSTVRVQQIAREMKAKKDGGGWAVEEF